LGTIKEKIMSNPSHTPKERKKKACPAGMKRDPATGRCVPMKSGHKSGHKKNRKK